MFDLNFKHSFHFYSNSISKVVPENNHQGKGYLKKQSFEVSLEPEIKFPFLKGIGIFLND